MVISQVYGGGGNSGATLTHDFIELYNRSSSAVNITGWSVQYTVSTGTTWQVTSLSGSLAPGQYYLIQEAQGSGGTTPLPTPDAIGTISMSATSGKVALVSNSSAITGSCPSGSPIVDFVGYGSSANCFEGSGPTSTLSNTTAALRNGNGTTDTDDNAADFTAGTPNPRNSSFGSDMNQPPTVSTGGPYSADEGGSVLLTAVGSDPENNPLTYAWDLDNNGVYETPGQSVTFSAAALDGPGSAAVGVQVTDIAGLTAIAQTTININNVAPMMNALTFSPATSTLGNAMSASATFSDPAPNDAPFSCTVDYDDGSGAQTGIVSGSRCIGPDHTYTMVGSYTVTVAVTDKDGGMGLITAVHNVLFDFTGFFSPVDNLPALNVVKAGSGVPIKFGLGGEQGLSIMATSYPRSIRVACSASDPVNDIDDTVTLTPGSSTLSYDPITNQYIYVWKTEKSWKGTCRQFVLKLMDGTTHVANFKFN